MCIGYARCRQKSSEKRRTFSYVRCLLFRVWFFLSFIGCKDKLFSEICYKNEVNKGQSEHSSKGEQVQLRHIEGKGIGYDRVYTTIDILFTPRTKRFLRVFDFRGHGFDDRKFAANARF